MMQWRLLSRPGCHLCDELLEALTVRLPAAVRIQRCNVDERADWRAAYGRRIPVLLDATDRVLYAADTPGSLDQLVSVAKRARAE